MYYDLPKRADSSVKIRQLIDLFKSMLIDANHDKDDEYAYYTNGSVKTLGAQIQDLFSYDEPTNGYKIFMENWQYWFDACFDIFMKSQRNDSRTAIYRLDLRTIYTKCKKFNDHKRLPIYLCEKLLGCTKFLNANWQQIDQKAGALKTKNEGRNDSTGEKKEVSCLECYFDFTRAYVDLLIREVNDIKGCCKLCLDHLVELSQLAHLSTDHIRIMSELLYKDNFYVLKDFLKVFLSIFIV